MNRNMNKGIEKWMQIKKCIKYEKDECKDEWMNKWMK